MKPEDINLSNINKSFEYEKLSRDIDSIHNIDDIKILCKLYLKLYLKQQEVISELSWQTHPQDKN